MRGSAQILRAKNERNSQNLADGGGNRVNRSVSERNYELGNYEKSVIVNNSRHKFDRAAALAELSLQARRRQTCGPTRGRSTLRGCRSWWQDKKHP